MGMCDVYTGSWADVSDRISNAIQGSEDAAGRLVSVMVVDGEAFIDAISKSDPGLKTREDATEAFSIGMDELWEVTENTLEGIVVSFGINLDTDTDEV